MSDEQTIYSNPIGNWRVIICSGLWGIPKYEIENFYDKFWHSVFDGGGDLKSCFIFLREKNIISPDEKKFLINKWCR